jgi:hypothetical protein
MRREAEARREPGAHWFRGEGQENRNEEADSSEDVVGPAEQTHRDVRRDQDDYAQQQGEK